MSGHHINDPARTVRIDNLTKDLVSSKLRVVGKVRLYDVENALVCIADDRDTLIVDISFCLSGFRSLPWLHEENTTVMTIGYLERLDSVSVDEDALVLVLRALLIKEQRGLNMKVWNDALEASESAAQQP